MVRKAASWVIVLLATLLVVELGLRLFSLFPVESAAFRYDPDVGYRIRNGTLGSGDGFNDVHDDQRKRGRRLLFIGDSFTYGTYPPDRVFPGLVEAAMVARGHPAVAYNRGLPGAGTSTYIPLARTFAARLQPETVVLTLYIGNDIEQSHPRQATRLFGGMVVTVNNIDRFGIGKRDFLAYYVLRKLYEHSLFAIRRDDEEIPPIPLEEGRLAGYLSAFEWLYVARREMECMRRDLPEFMQAAYQELPRRLATVRREIGAAKLLVVIAPARVQIDPIWRDEVLEFWELRADEFDFGLPNRTIARQLDALNIDYIDLSTALAASNRSVPGYNRRDTHWNRRGNEVAAQAITDWVLR